MPTVDLTPQVDLLVGALVLEDGHEVCTPDEHFQRVPGLRLYEAKTALGVSLSRLPGQHIPLRPVLGDGEGDRCSGICCELTVLGGHAL